MKWKGALCGLGAATLFGLSAPLAKLLLANIGPLVLAALFYLGAGLGLTIARLLFGTRPAREARVCKGDAAALVAIIVLGGVAGPLLMLYGLERLSAVAGSLLLNFEAPFTILLAVLLFKEHLGLRGMVAGLLVVAGALVLAYEPGDWRADKRGILAICGACLSWAIDNNLTQRLSLRDPIVVVRIKAFGAGTCTLGLALLMGQHVPARLLMPALAIGAFSFGFSILLDAYALRLLGAAREAMFFATAPFIGAIAAIPLFGERVGSMHLLSATLMGTGVFLLLGERHSHQHAHVALEHDHAHVHDEHHLHEHEGSVTEPHAHVHRHTHLVHDHPHVPDLHHRHEH